MQILLPTIKKMYNEEKSEIIKEKGTLRVNIDTSFKAHLKWEEQFSETLKCDLTTYTERVKTWSKDKNLAKANLLGMLKLLYCYIDSDELPTFKDFCGLFDVEVADEILNKIKVVIEEIGKSAGKN